VSISSFLVADAVVAPGISMLIDRATLSYI